MDYFNKQLQNRYKKINKIRSSIKGKTKNERKRKRERVESVVGVVEAQIEKDVLQLANKRRKIKVEMGEEKEQFEVLKNSRPMERYSDFGGIEKLLGEIKKYVHLPFIHPEVFTELKIEPIRGILLHGPPGSGKTMLAHAIAGELGAFVNYYKINAPQIVTWNSGETEGKLRTIFKIAVENAPSLVFIDEIDAIISKREKSKGMEKRLVSQLCICLDELKFSKTQGRMVMVIAATNRPETLDHMLRRSGRFDKEISFGIPDENARERILSVISKKRKVSEKINYGMLSKLTPGYVGADLTALLQEASSIAIERITKDSTLEINDETITKEDLRDLCITMEDFVHAIPKVQPSSRREGFATVPDVTWEDIGSLEEIREELKTNILNQIRFPKKYKKLGLKEPAGIILFGPPGCGKTLLAKAVANDSHANFISVKGPELLNKYVGETEKAVRTVFQRARSSSPCIIFFDELDALCPRRSGGSVNKVTDRVVNQLLIEMDGLNSRKDVYIIAATNRIDIIDSAILRPGRLGKVIYVPLPNANARIEIMKTLTRNSPIAKDVNLSEVSKKCVNFSGADIKMLVREASLLCLKDSFLENMDDDDNNNLIVQKKHFELALKKVGPSVSIRDILRYERMALTMKKGLKKQVQEKKKEDTPLE